MPEPAGNNPETIYGQTAAYASYPSLVDKAVFITGGADGIGSGLVEQFAMQGAKVGFADRQADKAAITIDRCAAKGVTHTPVFYEVDLVNVDELRAVLAQAAEDLGTISVLVNNAAADDRHGWEDMTVEYWNDRLNTNLRHYFFAIQSVAPGMIAAGGGSIINVSSIAAVRPTPEEAPYGAAKAGLNNLTTSFARAFGPTVRVNTIMPGPFLTDISKAWDLDRFTQMAKKEIPLQRGGQPEEVVGAALYFASDASSYTTGAILKIDGGTAFSPA